MVAVGTTSAIYLSLEVYSVNGLQHNICTITFIRLHQIQIGGFYLVESIFHYAEPIVYLLPRFDA